MVVKGLVCEIRKTFTLRQSTDQKPVEQEARFVDTFRNIFDEGLKFGAKSVHAIMHSAS